MEKSLHEALEYYKEVGWSEKLLQERQQKFEWRHDKTGHRTEYKTEPTENGLQYIVRFKESMAQSTSVQVQKGQSKIKYADAKKVCWQIMTEKFNRDGTTFSDEGNVIEVIPQLIRYFIGDKNSDLQLNKGIYLWGDTGSGKTFLIETMQEMVKRLGLHRQLFKIYNTQNIAENALVIGNLDSSIYVSNSACFDDFGMEEPIVRVYNNEIKPMTMIVNRAYEKFKNSHQMTHFTSMLPPTVLLDKDTKGIKQIDRRVYERILEMTTVVKLSGKSKRNISRKL